MKKLLKTSLCLLLIAIIASGSNVNATVNTGQGTQRYVESLDEMNDSVSKGRFFGFFAGQVMVDSGTWVSVGFGVIDTEYAESCEVAFQGHISFLSLFDIFFYWDGELIEDLFDAENPDSIIIIDEREDGSCMLLTQHRFFIPPPSVGEHNFDTEFFLLGEFLFGSFNIVKVVPQNT